MIVTNHCIGDIFFITESDIKITGLHQGPTTRYLSSSSEINIGQYIHQFHYSELTMPSLTSDERQRIQKCHFLTRLGRGGMQIVPLIIKKGDEKRFEKYLTKSVEILDFPILRLPHIRDRLNESLPHFENVFLIFHPLTIEIRDYSLNRIDIYFAEEMKEVLKTKLMSCRTERIFRVFFPDFDAFMVHSSAIIRKKKAIFFLAPDEGGKTTVAKQVTPATVLGDDQVILRKQNGKFVAHSTPWGKIVNDPICAPLGAFFFLEKSSVFELTPIKPRQVVEFIWEEHTHFTDALSKDLRIRSFNLLSEAVNTVPVFRLRTPINGVDWDRIDACF